MILNQQEPSRREYIGASEIASALGLGSYSNPQEVWARKTGRRKENKPTPDMLRGTYLEPVVREHCVTSDERVEKVVAPRFHQDPEIPHVAAHDDGGIFGFGRADEGVLEIKCPNGFAFRSMREDGLPSENVLQIQYVMGLSRREHGVFAVHCADTWETLLFPVEFDAKVFDYLRRQADVFMRQFVKQDRMPPMLVEEAPPELPVIRGEAIHRDDEEWGMLMEQWDTYDRTKKAIESIWDGEKGSEEPGLKDQILAAMGDVKTVIGSGYKCHQIVTKGRRFFDTKKLEKLGPFDPYLTAEIMAAHMEDAEKLWGELAAKARIDVNSDEFHSHTAPARFPRIYREFPDE
jgi:putative phage-type endonuclease